MKRPSLQFYPGDWRNNAKLRRCSDAARGAWVDILCILHDEDEYGIARYPLIELARAATIPLKLAKELASKGVLKGSDTAHEAYVFSPRHAGKLGNPVTLVEAGNGPCWYCSRFVRDEWIRLRRGQTTQFSSENQPPKHPPKGGFGAQSGDGPSSPSSSSSTIINTGEGGPPAFVNEWPGLSDREAWIATQLNNLTAKQLPADYISSEAKKLLQKKEEPPYPYLCTWAKNIQEGFKPPTPINGITTQQSTDEYQLERQRLEEKTRRYSSGA